MMVTEMESEAKVSADSRDDVELIDAIATERDESALSELLQRYQSDCYSLALRIAGNRASAEDIVQEAMLRVWTTASSYRGDGPVRAWLLRIVARQSLNAIKKTKSESIRMKKAERQAESAAPCRELETAELFGALRREYERLPDLDRQLIGLHYGGGLSQQEISDSLSIPQQTISNHLNRSLKSLRAALSGAGFAITPMIATEGIGDALSSGVQAPPGLKARVLKRIAGKGSARRERSRNEAGSGNLSKAILAVAAGCAGGAVLWLIFGTGSPANKPAPATNIAQAIAPYDWHRRWTFESGVPDELKVVSGTFTSNKEQKSLDCPARVDFTTTHPLPAEPMLFTMKCRIIDVSKNFFFHQSLGLPVSETNTGTAELNWRQMHANVKTPEIERRLYIYQQYWATMINGQFNSLSQLRRTAEGGTLQFALENLSVQEITATPLKLEELPEFIRNPKFDEKD